MKHLAHGITFDHFVDNEPSGLVDADVHGGTFTIMLYNRSSVNYYIEIMFLRRLFRWCLLASFMPAVMAAVIAEFANQR